MTGYHVTRRTNRASIAERGLLTCAPVIYPSGRVERGSDAGYVWLFLDLAIARAAAAGRTWGGGDAGNDVWVVDLDGLDVIADPHPGWGPLKPGWDDASRAIAGDLGPERLTLHDEVRLGGRYLYAGQPARVDVIRTDGRTGIPTVLVSCPAEGPRLIRITGERAIRIALDDLPQGA